MRARRTWRATAAGVLVVGWALLLRGLYLSPVSTDPRFDLEAGGRFAINFSVYLPALALTLVVLITAPLTVVPRRGSVTGAILAAVAATFAAWVDHQDDLVAYRPGLDHAAALSGAIAVAAVLMFVAEAAYPLTGGAPEDDSRERGVSQSSAP